MNFFLKINFCGSLILPDALSFNGYHGKGALFSFRPSFFP